MVPLRALPGALVLLALVLAGCSAPPPSPDGAGPLVVGTEAAFPPFEDVDAATGRIVGFDADLMRAIGQRMNRTVELRNLAFTALIPSLQNGQIDLAISAMTINEERLQQVDFSIPYYTANQSVAVPRGATGIRNASDLEGKRVAVQLGTTAEAWLVENLVGPGKMRNESVLRFESFPLALEAMLRGDADAVMMDAPAVKAAAKQRGTLQLAFEISTGENYGIAVQKGDSALLLAVNQALRDLAASGELQRLKETWSI